MTILVLLVLSGCRPAPTLIPPTAAPPTAAASTAAAIPTATHLLPKAAPTSAPALPTLALDETSAKRLDLTQFDGLHSPFGGEDGVTDANEYLILGNVPVAKPAADLSPDLAAYLGRWEGYVMGPPVNKDRKVVLVISAITERDGVMLGYSGTNLQYPDRAADIHFRVVPGQPPSIEFQVAEVNGAHEYDHFTLDPESGLLRGSSKIVESGYTVGPFVLSRERTFKVYKDYPGYLAGKRIAPQHYTDKALEHYGGGYLLYLPEGYEAEAQKAWPLIFFLHGYGDRGENPFLLAKASPFMFIREKGPLPFIIAAPLLSSYEGYSSFPEAYMDGALAEVQANYRVDSRRIYVTGLSMGGEATYRFALHRPDIFAAIAPLSAYLNHADTADMASIKTLPVWAIHGADDPVYPVSQAQEPVDALKAVGGDIRFTVLEGHDHDVWTDTYLDPAFYDWLLEHQLP